MLVYMHNSLAGFQRLKTSKESRVILYDTENLESTTKVNRYIVSVRGQQLVLCRASVNCTGNDLGTAMDGRSCCLDNPRALAYVSNDGSCVPCVGESVYNNIMLDPDNWMNEYCYQYDNTLTHDH